ncbi:TPA: helix-turn-helix domain-containing protein [Enterobacter hormaechei]|nr:helix-turn-helix domain-containing protein [Enterobacter hormaechei]MKW16265.1 helix-turn-helix domain-containing protein [Salmonella enterica subsp. enterica]HCT6421402.1 helix-turn-helix domain-containing protein [Enterobacter hormaechei]HCU2366622.1 helix-turn-helix domain-containing protein [Enterobacter hormaechei]HEC0360697.1 helix-turn-helix domain-containing protein [Enterobacter hormaechei]
MVLDLSNTEMLLLIHLISFIHFADTPAFPSISTLAARINQHPRTVQRTINKLISKGFLKRKIRAKSVNDKGLSNLYSVEPLIEKLFKSIDNKSEDHVSSNDQQGVGEMKTIDQLVRIAAAGGGLRINASTKTVDQLVRIAAAAGNSMNPNKAQLVLFDLESKSTDQLVRIAAAGKGTVLFELE